MRALLLATPITLVLSHVACSVQKLGRHCLVLCENSTETESHASRQTRGNRRGCRPGSWPELIAPDLRIRRVLHPANLSGQALRHGLAAAAARLRRSPLRRLGQ